MKRKAPWFDFSGNEIREGDTIRHPSGETGVVCFWESQSEPSDQWRVFYAGRVAQYSRLCLQIGERGRAVVVRPVLIDTRNLDGYC